MPQDKYSPAVRPAFDAMHTRIGDREIHTPLQEHVRTAPVKPPCCRFGLQIQGERLYIGKGTVAYPVMDGSEADLLNWLPFFPTLKDVAQEGDLDQVGDDRPFELITNLSDGESYIILLTYCGINTAEVHILTQAEYDDVHTTLPPNQIKVLLGQFSVITDNDGNLQVSDYVAAWCSDWRDSSVIPCEISSSSSDSGGSEDSSSSSDSDDAECGALCVEHAGVSYSLQSQNPTRWQGGGAIIDYFPLTGAWSLIISGVGIFDATGIINQSDPCPADNVNSGGLGWTQGGNPVTVSINLGACKSSSSSSEKSSSGSSESESESDGSESASSKSNAIVPFPFHDEKYAALYVMEAPEVLFQDVLVIDLDQRVTVKELDPYFRFVCARTTLKVSGHSVDQPAPVGITLSADQRSVTVTQNPLFYRFWKARKITLTITGVRKGFNDPRFRFEERTKEQFIANERSINANFPSRADVEKMRKDENINE